MEEQDYRTTYELEEHNWWFVGMRRICTEWIEREPPDGSAPWKVLDVGCGTGVNLEVFERFGSTVGVDQSPTALAFCQQRGRTGLLQGLGEQLPLPDQSFDLVTAIDVVEHIEDDARAVAEWVRVLRPGGRLLVLTSAYRWLWSGHDVSNHHVRRYRRGEVRSLLVGAGLEQVRVTHANACLLPAIAAVRGAERLRGGGRTPPARKDTAEVPGPINRALIGLLGVEARAVRRVDLPVGVSIFAGGQKPMPSLRSGTTSG